MYLIPIALVCLSCLGFGRGLDLTTIDELSNEMKSPHNVFALLVIPWLLGLCNSSAVVTVEIQRARGIREHTNLNKELPYPNTFLRSLRSCDVLGFCCRIGHCLLLGTLLANRTTIYFEHETGLRL